MKANKLPAVSKTGLAAALLFFTLNGLDANAQNSHQSGNSRVAARLTRYEVKPEFQEVIRKAISDYVLYSLEFESNIL